MNSKYKKKSLFSIYKFIFFIVFIITMLAISFYFDLHKNFSIENFRKLILNFGFWGPFVFILLYSSTSIIFFLISLLSISSGIIWGSYLGTTYTVLGATIASIIPFFISRLLGHEFVEKVFKRNKNLNICDKFLAKNGFISVFIMRLIPFLPWNVVNYGSGLYNIKLRDYLLATLFGIIPKSFTYNLIGSSIGKPLDKMKIIIISVLVILFITSTLIAKKIISKKYKKKNK